MKKCNICNVEKPFSEFNKGNSKEGLQNKCIECQKEYYQNNKEYFFKKAAQYKINDLEKVLETNRISNAKVFKSEGYGVYMITHIPTQCYYIGEGWIKSRKNAHFSQLKRGKNNSIRLQNHFNKYPNLDDWEFKVIKSWKHKNIKGREIEDKLIREGLNNNSAKILNKKVGINK